MKNCQNCHRVSQDGANFCKYCGVVLPASPQLIPETRKSPQTLLIITLTIVLIVIAAISIMLYLGESRPIQGGPITVLDPNQSQPTGTIASFPDYGFELLFPEEWKTVDDPVAYLISQGGSLDSYERRGLDVLAVFEITENSGCIVCAQKEADPETTLTDLKAKGQILFSKGAQNINLQISTKKIGSSNALIADVAGAGSEYGGAIIIEIANRGVLISYGGATKQEAEDIQKRLIEYLQYARSI